MAFAIWNLIVLLKPLFTGNLKFTINIYAFVGFDLFAIIWLIIGCLRQKSLYKYIETNYKHKYDVINITTKRPTIRIEFSFLENKERNLLSYMPHIIINNSEDYLGIKFTENFERKDTLIIAEVELLYYDNGVDYSRLQPGIMFSIKEGATTVAKGKVI